MPKHGPGASPDAGFFLILDEKPDGRFFLGHDQHTCQTELSKWKAVGIVHGPYTIEHVSVFRYEIPEEIVR